MLRRLPPGRLDGFKRPWVRVGPSSAVRVNRNVYSVDSRLIGEQIEVRVYAERLEVWYAQQCLETMPCLRGEGERRIQYRRVIDWLVRKPGAFDNYILPERRKGWLMNLGILFYLDPKLGSQDQNYG